MSVSVKQDEWMIIEVWLVGAFFFFFTILSTFIYILVFYECCKK